MCDELGYSVTGVSHPDSGPAVQHVGAMDSRLMSVCQLGKGDGNS